MSEKTRVMLVEDESTAREILSFYLNTLFDEVIVAEDGQEGINIFLQNHLNLKEIDLIITDIKMPRVDGLEMIEKIKEYDNKQKFIIVSAYKEEELLLKSINLRVIGYFVKPLNVDNMMNILTRAKEEVLRDKSEVKQSDKLKINKIYTFDKQSKLLYANDKLVKLSKKELELLEVLLQKRGQIVRISTCKEKLWRDENKSDATFRTVMKRLKDKLILDDFILSRKGQGYIIL